MQFITDHIRKSLVKNSKKLKKQKSPYDLDNLKKTEWSSVFENYMRNRMIIGALRYGLLKTKANQKFDYVGFIETRLKKYEETKNSEFLVDVANGCMLEFLFGDNEFTMTENTEKCKMIDSQGNKISKETYNTEI